MDNIIISLIDAFFFAIGGLFLYLLRKLGIKTPELGHWTQVVLGFVIFIVVTTLAIIFSMEILK